MGDFPGEATVPQDCARYYVCHSEEDCPSRVRCHTQGFRGHGELPPGWDLARLQWPASWVGHLAIKREQDRSRQLRRSLDLLGNSTGLDGNWLGSSVDSLLITACTWSTIYTSNA